MDMVKTVIWFLILHRYFDLLMVLVSPESVTNVKRERQSAIILPFSVMWFIVVEN